MSLLPTQAMVDKAIAFTNQAAKECDFSGVDFAPLRAEVFQSILISLQCGEEDTNAPVPE